MEPGPCSATGTMHMVVRQLFSRLVFSLQFESSLSMKIISFWLWLEGRGHVDFLACIQSFDNYHLQSLALAGKTFVEALYLRSSQANPGSVEEGSFLKEAAQGIVFYLNNVCYKVLQDLLEAAQANERIHRINQAHQLQQNVRAKAPMSPKDLLSKIKASFTACARSQEQASSSRSSMPMPSPKIHILKDIENPIEQCLSTSPLVASLFDTLNIKDPEEEPADAIQMYQEPDVPRDERTLFVTFSNGYPFTADELYEFFWGNFGDVEVICVQEPAEPRPPLYAHITFYTQETLYRVLGGRLRVKFVIHGKHLWARKFVPKRKKVQKF